jgi:hypothetical protein
MTIHETIAAAEALLPGVAAAEGEIDPRWQAIISVGEFIATDPEAVWSFILRWGGSPDSDLRMAVATCLLEHLLESHFDEFIDRVEAASAESQNFGVTVASCWTFGQVDESVRADRFARLRNQIRSRAW